MSPFVTLTLRLFVTEEYINFAIMSRLFVGISLRRKQIDNKSIATTINLISDLPVSIQMCIIGNQWRNWITEKKVTLFLYITGDREFRNQHTLLWQ